MKYNVERFFCNLYKLEWKFGAAQEIWVLVAHGKCIFNHTYWCSRDSVLKCGQCLHLHTYFVYKSSKGYIVSNTTFLQDRLLLHCSTLGYEPKSNVLAHLIYYFFTIYNQFSLLWNVQRMNWMYFLYEWLCSHLTCVNLEVLGSRLSLNVTNIVVIVDSW